MKPVFRILSWRLSNKFQATHKWNHRLSQPESLHAIPTTVPRYSFLSGMYRANISTTLLPTTAISFAALAASAAIYRVPEKFRAGGLTQLRRRVIPVSWQRINTAAIIAESGAGITVIKCLISAIDWCTLRICTSDQLKVLATWSQQQWNLSALSGKFTTGISYYVCMKKWLGSKSGQSYRVTQWPTQLSAFHNLHFKRLSFSEVCQTNTCRPIDRELYW